MHCILHIGTEKTATTLLQEWLYENRAALSTQGIALTDSALMPNNRKLVSYFQDHVDGYLVHNNLGNDAARAQFFSGFEADFTKEISRLAKTHHTVILTSEHFHSRLTKAHQVTALKAMLDRFFDSFSVLCYFREQSRVRTSLYSTALKIKSQKPIEAFHARVTPQTHYYNYHDFFKKWEDAFGKDALTPRLFDKKRMTDGDIRKDFLAHVLPDVDQTVLSFETTSANKALTADQAEMFLAINRTYPPEASRIADPLNAKLKREVLASPLFAENRAIFDPRQAEFFAMFDESNRAFFKRYFGTSKNLFDPPKAQTNKAREAAFTTTDIAAFMSELLKDQSLLALTDTEIPVLTGAISDILRQNTLAKQDAEALASIMQRLQSTLPEDTRTSDMQDQDIAV